MQEHAKALIEAMTASVSVLTEALNSRAAVSYIHSHYRNEQMNVSELAREAGVASSAVIRFCTTLGFEGFVERIVL